MTDIGSLSMVSYYNHLVYRGQAQPGTQQSLPQQPQQHTQSLQAPQQHPAASGPTADQQYWFGYPHHAHPAHHQSAGTQQYLDPADVLAWPSHHHTHPHYAHHMQQYQHHHQAYQQQQQQQAQHPSAMTEWSGDEANNGVGAGEPSPPITVSGSEVSSPGTPTTPPANNNNNNNSTTPVRPSQIRSPYEWMKKPSYQSQPNPGKTRTKDKYRVVYTDHQRLELEKEFHYSRYITIRRKAELASNLALSERQVKIWFQNRRAKERKQVKKREELEHKDTKPGDNLSAGGMAGLAALGGMGMLGGLMSNGGSPPLGLGPPHHSLSLGPPGPPLHPHSHPHTHAHSVLGL